MPNNVEPPMGMRNGPVPPRADSAPYNGFTGRMPTRPSTASGHRPPPQRFYPNQPPPPGPSGPPGPPGPPSFDDGYDYQPPPQAWANDSNVRASFGDFYDAYYHPRDSEQFGPPHDQFGPPHDQYGPPHDQYGPPHDQYGPPHDQYGPSQDHYGPPQDQFGPPHDSRNDIPDFDAIAAENGPRASLDQHMQPVPPSMAQQSGPGRMPEMNRTKSQPNLREPQSAVFEMAPDIPPVPNGGFQPYNGQQPPVGLPSGPASGLPAHPGPGPGSGHPTPIRAGLMANSMVSNMADKPPPVRQYNGPPPAAIGAQGRPPPVPVQNGKSAANEAFPVTPEELESLRTVVKSNPNDQQTALTLAKKLVEAADVLVPRLPDPKTRGRARERYVLDAHKILKKLASAQNPDAMFYLADCLGRGALGLEADNKEAFTLYQSAAKLGHAGAAYRTAVCCEIGNDEGGGTRKDPLKAIQWYKRSATLGDTPAMYKVGMIMLKGLLGQQRNPREAVGWLKRAAERADAENPHALHELGLLYESAQPNDTILRDEAYAFSLFEQAAHLGYKFSQYRMGCVYEYGLMGCPVDPRASIMWYSRAATQEEHQSELSLSGWYLTGSEGVLQQSDTEAYLWARKAAQAGLAKAEYAMGYFTETGIGVPANLEDAKRWYWRAAGKCSCIPRSQMGWKTNKMMCSPGLPQGAGTARGPQAVGQECAATPRAHLEKQVRKATGAGRRVLRDVGCLDAPHAATPCACQLSGQRECPGRSIPGTQAEATRRSPPGRQVFAARLASTAAAGWLGRPVLGVAPVPHPQGRRDAQGFVMGPRRNPWSCEPRPGSLSCGKGGERRPSRVVQRRRLERMEGRARWKGGIGFGV